MKHLFATRGTHAKDSHPSFVDDIKSPALLSRSKEYVTGSDNARYTALAELRERVVIELRENGKPPEQFDDIHGSIQLALNGGCLLPKRIIAHCARSV